MQKQTINLINGRLPVVKTNLGVKRHCVRCSNRFYDLGKNPVPCPKCKHMNDINAPFKPRRRGKAASKPTLVQKEKAVAKPKGDAGKEDRGRGCRGVRGY
jgi:uncharacterized protein (TIGR02300 family)